MRDRLAVPGKAVLSSGHRRRVLGLAAALLLLSSWVVAVASAKEPRWQDRTFEVIWAGSGSYAYNSLLHQLNCAQSLDGTGNYNFRDTWRIDAKVRPGTKKSGPEFKIVGDPQLEGGPFGDLRNHAHITGKVTRTEDAESCFGLVKPQAGGKVNCTSDTFSALVPGPGQEERAGSGFFGPLNVFLNDKLESVQFQARAWGAEKGKYTGEDPHMAGCAYWNTDGFTPGAATNLGAQLTYAGVAPDFSDLAKAGAPRKRKGHPSIPRVIESRQYEHTKAGSNCLPLGDADHNDSCLVTKNQFYGTIEMVRTK